MAARSILTCLERAFSYVSFETARHIQNMNQLSYHIHWTHTARSMRLRRWKETRSNPHRKLSTTGVETLSTSTPSQPCSMPNLIRPSGRGRRYHRLTRPVKVFRLTRRLERYSNDGEMKSRVTLILMSPPAVYKKA